MRRTLVTFVSVVLINTAIAQPYPYEGALVASLDVPLMEGSLSVGMGYRVAIEGDWVAVSNPADESVLIYDLRRGSRLELFW